MKSSAAFLSIFVRVCLWHAKDAKAASLTHFGLVIMHRLGSAAARRVLRPTPRPVLLRPTPRPVQLARGRARLSTDARLGGDARRSQDGRATRHKAEAERYTQPTWAQLSAAVASARESAAARGYSREEMAALFNQTLEHRSRRLAAGFFGFAVGLAGVMHYFRTDVKETVSVELSDVATRALGDEKMQQQAQQVTMQTLQALFVDEATVQHSVKFLTDVAAHPATRQALITLLVEALKNEAVLNEALALTLWVLDDERTRTHVNEALMAVISSDAFLDVAAKFAVRWLATDQVTESVTELFRDSSVKVLEDEAVREMAQTFVHDILDQPHLQAKTGEHLWSAVRGWLIAPKKPRANTSSSVGVSGAASTTAAAAAASTPPTTAAAAPGPSSTTPPAAADAASAASSTSAASPAASPAVKADAPRPAADADAGVLPASTTTAASSSTSSAAEAKPTTDAKIAVLDGPPPGTGPAAVGASGRANGPGPEQANTTAPSSEAPQPQTEALPASPSSSVERTKEG